MNKQVARIESLIKSCKINEYKIICKNTETCELYYVLNKLETARKVNTEDITVTIYKNFEGYKGSSVFTVSQAYTDEEIKEKIVEAFSRCEYVKNDYFDMPQKSEVNTSKFKSEMEYEDLNDIANNVARAIFKADEFREGWINSTEIFVNRYNNEFLNSNGVHVTYPQMKLMIEVIPTWSGEKEEVELYFSKSSRKIDYEKITNNVQEKLEDAKNRSVAKKLENVKTCKVILGAEEVKTIVRMFATHLAYSTQYRQMSKFKVGDAIQSGDECDKLTVVCTPFLEDSSLSSPIDSLGTVLKDITLIKDGIAENLYGDAMFGYYLKVDKPTGDYNNFKVSGGSKSLAEMKNNEYLECINFSSFQLDIFNGYFGGEVRLGMYFDGKDLTPVTGFSVTGNIYEDINKMRFSVEEESLEGYQGPKYLEVIMSIN